MRLHRIYIDAILSCGARIALTDDAARHVGAVLRLKPGQLLHVFNGTGGCYLAKLTQAGKRTVEIETLEFYPAQAESSLQIILGQGISKGQHMDYTIQKAVELGVTHIIPLSTEFSNVHLDEERAAKRLLHWRKIIISACEQCGRNRLPLLSTQQPLADWVQQDQSTLKLLLEPASATGLKDIRENPGSVALLCGPEGGFSEAEIIRAQAHGFRGIKLGPRILRTETAAVAALAAIQVLWGDMG